MPEPLPSGLKNVLEEEHVTGLMAALAARPSELGPKLEAEPAVLSFIAEEVGPRLAAYGVTDQRIDAVGNLIARTGERRAGSGRLLLVMNAMTQPAFDMPDPFKPRIVDGFSYGIDGRVMIARGLSEQKANMAAMLAAVGALMSRNEPIPGELVILCCPSGETGRHDAIAHAVEKEGVSADMAVLGGTALEVAIGNRGRIDLELVIKGRRSHSSRPELGANAALTACQIVSRLIEKGNTETSHPQLGMASLTLTGIRSEPASTHTVQSRCKATLDRRLLPGEDPFAVTDELRRLIEDEAPYRDRFSGAELQVELRPGAYMYPSWVEEDAPVVRAIQAASSEAGAGERPCIHLPNAFDQGYLNHRGIPAVNFGCGEFSFAHTHNDLASINRTVLAASIFYHLVLKATSRAECCA